MHTHQLPVRGPVIYPVILAGGAGTRLWPLSRVMLPKQLLPLVTDKTMLQETALRVAGRHTMMPPLVVCGNDHRFMVAEQLRDIGLAPLGILLEPCGRNTAPAVAAAASYLQEIDPDGILLVLPADQMIDDLDAFGRAVACATQLAAEGALVTFGVPPRGPATEYGYIERGRMVRASQDAFEVHRFVEKPDADLAQRLVDDGACYWNSGMFLFRADRYLSELREWAPAMETACATAVRLGARDLDFCRLEEAAFANCDSLSIDYAVMERTSTAVVVPTDMGWRDVGSWAALWQGQAADARGNVARGDVYLDEVGNSLVRAESRIVAVVGVRDLIVVETADAVLVAHRDQAERVSGVVGHLALAQRSERIHHTKVHRPWGYYEGIDLGARFQVKRICVRPGARLSLQMHHHRAEHWVVVSGTAKVTCGDSVSILSENEATFIPIGMQHRLENPGKVPLHIIEVQSGTYLSEDDIVRFDDDYQRSDAPLDAVA